VLVIVEMVSPEEEGAGASSLKEEGDGASSRAKKFGCGRRKLKKGATMVFYYADVGHPWPHSSAFGARVR
jgi:hypothetical protein